MCGRIALYAELNDLAAQFRFMPDLVEDAYRPSWNIAPTTPILAVTAGEGQRHAAIMRWGFTFRRSGSSSRPLFNARSETIMERPVFRNAFSQRRCLVIANGFYEWRSRDGAKTPMWIHRRDERPFALAGIYNRGHEPAVSVITCAPNSLMTPIHNRMPVILEGADYDDWLDPEAMPAMLQGLLAPKEWHDLTALQVTDAVNRAGNDGPHLIAPANDAPPRLL